MTRSETLAIATGLSTSPMSIRRARHRNLLPGCWLSRRSFWPASAAGKCSSGRVRFPYPSNSLSEESVTSTNRFPLLGCLAALILVPAGAFAAGANANADTYVSSTSPASNFGTATSVNVGVGSNALIQFDLSGLPAGLTVNQINKATMTFYVNTALTAGGVDISQVTSAWAETAVNNNNRPTYLSAFALNVATATSKQYVTVDVTQLVKD